MVFSVGTAPGAGCPVSVFCLSKNAPCRCVRKEVPHMDFHVLVLAMSDLNAPFLVKNRDNEPVLNLTEYEYVDQNGVRFPKTWSGIGQLEIIPQFLRDRFRTEITHVVILETPRTKTPVNRPYAELNERYRERFGKDAIAWQEGEPVSATAFFKKRMEAMGFSPQYIGRDIDVKNPETGLKELLETIQRLYADCEAQDGDWKLWLDTHGGFRDISMAMFALMQVLSTTDASGIPKLTDQQKLIPISGVYSVEYDRELPYKPILDRTEFYRSFTSPTLQAYMNYGQYQRMALDPNTDMHDGPFAFVSYKHKVCEKEFRTVIGFLRDAHFRYWFDFGIPIRWDWQKTLDEGVAGCSVFFGLITQAYLESYPCLRELKHALSLGKPIILISLDGTTMYLNRPICLADPQNENNTVELTGEDLEQLGKAQHVQLNDPKYMSQDNVLQSPSLLRDLNRVYGDVLGTIGVADDDPAAR